MWGYLSWKPGIWIYKCILANLCKKPMYIPMLKITIFKENIYYLFCYFKLFEIILKLPTYFIIYIPQLKVYYGKLGSNLIKKLILNVLGAACLADNLGSTWFDF